MTAAPEPHLGDDVLGPGDDRTGQPTQALVERDIDRVGELSDLSGTMPKMWSRLPDPGAVQVQRHAAIAARARERLELLPRRQQVAGVTQRQLQQNRTEPPRDGREVVDRRDHAAGRQQRPLEAVEQPRAVLLVVQQMGQRRYGDAPAPVPIAPDPQHRLLRHGAAREHHRGGLAQQLGDLALQRGDRTAVAVAVPGRVAGAVELGDDAAQLVLRRHRVPAHEVAFDAGHRESTTLGQGRWLLRFSHGAHPRLIARSSCAGPTTLPSAAPVIWFGVIAHSYKVSWAPETATGSPGLTNVVTGGPPGSAAPFRMSSSLAEGPVTPTTIDEVL